MSSKRPFRGKRASKKLVRDLLKDSSWVLDEDLARRVYYGEVYTHPDGRFLQVFPIGGGVIHTAESLARAFAIIEETVRQQGKPIHVLTDRFLYGEDFPAHVPELVETLATRFKIPRAELDYSRDSLAKIDAKAKRAGRRKCLEADLFPAIVAYVGEVMKAATEGEWRMRWIQQFSLWEPWVVANGRFYDPFLFFFDEDNLLWFADGTHVELVMGGRRDPDSMGQPAFADAFVYMTKNNDSSTETSASTDEIS
jgi:hypothetical protein